MKATILIAVALSLATASAANANHKRHHARHYGGPAVAYVPASPYYVGGPRPIWGAPQQCFTDEGYGRYLPCGTGSNRR